MSSFGHISFVIIILLIRISSVSSAEPPGSGDRQTIPEIRTSLIEDVNSLELHERKAKPYFSATVQTPCGINMNVVLWATPQDFALLCQRYPEHYYHSSYRHTHRYGQRYDYDDNEYDDEERMRKAIPVRLSNAAKAEREANRVMAGYVDEIRSNLEWITGDQPGEIQSVLATIHDNAKRQKYGGVQLLPHIERLLILVRDITFDFEGGKATKKQTQLALEAIKTILTLKETSPLIKLAALMQKRKRDRRRPTAYLLTPELQDIFYTYEALDTKIKRVAKMK
eukprot:UN00482